MRARMKASDDLAWTVLLNFVSGVADARRYPVRVWLRLT
jgi:hypothetical protein